jgi:hypothetical protein
VECIQHAQTKIHVELQPARPEAFKPSLSWKRRMRNPSNPAFFKA